VTFPDRSAIVAPRLGTAFKRRESGARGIRFFTVEARLAVVARRDGLEVH
jgi:hypothetical protein